MIATSCEICVFATWQGNEQKGCKLNRISKLVENGAELDKVTENGKTHFNILNRWCNKCRNTDWGDRHPKRKWAEIASKEVQLKYDIIVYCEGSNTLEDIEKSLDFINTQTLLPNKVIFVIDFDFKTDIDDVVNLVRDSSKTIWNVISVKEGAQPLDEAAKSVDGFYYCVFGAGVHIPNNFLSKIESAINDDALQISAIEPDSTNNGMVIQKMLHDRLSGNIGGLILDKIKFLCEEQGHERLIRKYDEL